MMHTTKSHPWEELRTLIDQGRTAEIEQLIAGLEPGELVRTVFRLSSDEQRTLLTSIAYDTAAEVMEELPDAHVAELLDDISAEDAAHIVQEMSSDEQADLLAEMDDEDAEAILAEMDDEDAIAARRLLRFDADTAGGLMQTEFVRYPRSTLVVNVLEDLAAREDEYAQYGVHFIYVVLRTRKLLGVLRLRDLVLANPKTSLGEILKPATSVGPEIELEELSEFFHDHEINAVPVVDRNKNMLGVVRRLAVNEAISERLEGERLRQAGIVGGEELRSMPVTLRSRRRLAWLSVNIVLNMIAASVIAMYQDTLTAVIALAVFLPIVSDMSGCSGNQAVAVSMRELTLGVVVPRDVIRVWLKEVAVGLINGLALGILLALAAYLWLGNPWLGAVVGAALAINTIVAVSIGGSVPLLLKGFNIDPALASGPILTTITDMCGFFLVLSFATLALPLLT